MFLICIEGLSAILKDFEDRKLISGIKVARSAPPLTHMFFADDSYIFCKATVECADNVMTLLNVFEQASGQKINVDKSSVFFSSNTQQHLKTELCHKLGFKEASDHIHYLGLPNFVGRKKSAIFGFIKDKMQNRTSGWEKKLISQGGKEILLKTAAQSLPSHAMSVFLMPMEVCNQLENQMCKYWWRTDSKKDKNIHWKSWKRMCKRKTQGGIGFRTMRDYNIALLGNQGWRLLKHPEKLVSKIFKARYYPKGNFLSAKIGSSPSYVWRSVLESQAIIKKGIGCRVGNGNSINIESDPWLPVDNDPFIHTDSESIRGQKVSSLFSMEDNSWDTELVEDIFGSRDASIILSIPVDKEVEDSWYWRNDKFGNFIVKSAYLMLEGTYNNASSADNSGFWCKLWNLKIPPKVKIFLWRASSNCLPTKDNLIIKQVPVTNTCAVCNAYT